MSDMPVRGSNLNVQMNCKNIGKVEKFSILALENKPNKRINNF